MPETIKALLNESITQLKPFHESANIDARLLLSYCLQQDQAYLYTWPDKTPADAQINCFKKLIRKRIEGTPIAYLTGFRSFWTMNLKVNEATLIPRPETELLVEEVLAIIQEKEAASILDMGTGSGAIAIAIASECKHCRVIATDISSEALKVAHFNAQQYQVDNCTFIQSDWYSELDRNSFDIIVSNPPYVEELDPHLQQGDVRFEPAMALTSGSDGLNAIREIISHAHNYLKKNGYLLFEHGWKQANDVQDLLSKNGFINIKTIRDLNENDRVTLAQHSNSS